MLLSNVDPERGNDDWNAMRGDINGRVLQEG